MDPAGYLCRTCNYPLRGLPEPRCPECGNGFDPKNPRTMNTGRPTPSWAWRWMEPIGAGFLWFVGPAALLTLACFSAPKGYLGPFFLLFVFAWLPIGFWWFLRAALACSYHIWFSQPFYVHERKHLRWFLAPAVVLATMGALELGIPLRVAFEVSQPAMNRLAERAAQGELLPDQWVGCFYATGIRGDSDGVSFLCRGSGFLDVGGFVRGAPISQGEWRLERRFRNGWSAARYDLF